MTFVRDVVLREGRTLGETEIEFTKGAAGAVTGFQLRQRNQTQTAKRFSSG